jgi:cobalt-precorrin-5B (C1)-methyltransferase
MDSRTDKGPNSLEKDALCFTMAETLKTGSQLRRGWTTGACAAAAARAAYEALVTGVFPDPVEIVLPGGQRPQFALSHERLGLDSVEAGVTKDAGDDPDVTHGALVIATLHRAEIGSGVTFRAGPGVGTITRPGLPLPPGEPAINPVPREIIRAAIALAAEKTNGPPDVVVEISIPNGAKIAERTLNGRLGIVGGLSILGTTGIVVPFSCAAWIDTIHRGVDVARAEGLRHVAGATGSVSEAAVQRLYGLPETALIDMGDFVGGMLKYLRAHPVERVTIAGGAAKMSKLGQGLLDLHSRRGEVDLGWLAERAREAGGSELLAAAIRAANTGKEAFDTAAAAGVDLARPVAEAAWRTALRAIGDGARELEIVVVDRVGVVLARSGFKAVHRASAER